MLSKRIFDVVSSVIVLLFLSPVILLVSLLIKLDSKGPIFYISERIGHNENKFNLIKFRTMKIASDHLTITVGDRDSRITKIGYFLRKTKLDEIPQLLNVLKGEMSIVGPRPDVEKYKSFYKNCFNKYFEMKPGITSYSSMFFRNESELYINVDDPEKVYIENTIPQKVKLDRQYYSKMGLVEDLKIIFKTLYIIVKE